MTDTTIPHERSEGNPPQHAGGAPREPLGEHEHPTHHHDHGHDNSPEGIRKEIRRYLIVFGMLGVLTIITVAIALGLTVATVKASLVAAFFMHLVSEKKLIYAVLAITVLFFGVLLWGPWHHRNNAQNSYPGYDVNASQPATTATAGSHDNQGHTQQGH